MWIARDMAALRRERDRYTKPVALIPTMGALHAGHLAHVPVARKVAEHVIVSIFVNPTQFGPQEDFARYPRQESVDLNLCRDAGVDGIFLPDVEAMYPAQVIGSEIDVPELTSDLEGLHRPGHFAGVCRVVLKLLNATQADYVTLGCKDYQQLRTLDALIQDLMLRTRVLEVETLREADGLALSSRNQYLGEEQRRFAVGIYKALCEARAMVEEQGEVDPQVVERAMSRVLAVHGFEVDYAVLRHPRTLTSLQCIEPELTGGVVGLVAAKLGNVRLIDNLRMGMP